MTDPVSDSRADKKARKLRDVCSGVIVVAHEEDTSALRNVLTADGFHVDEVRGPYRPEQLEFSAVMQALVNHANAWRIAKTRDRPTIVVEADFVPVIGFGDLPVPSPTEELSRSLAYLYAVGPEVWDLTEQNVARGRGGGMVALLIPPKVAGLLEDFFDEQIAANPSGAYAPWDARLGYWLKERGIESYIPYRHYGEHGGIGNPEHAGAGLGRPHRADVLAGRLAFLPNYARSSVTRFWKTRIKARLWGLARLLTGRYLAWHDFARSNRSQMVRFAVGRQLFLSSPSKRERRAT